ncbi:hypothetical protein PIB30_021627 [Stylosanthes scabra]|uniref:Fe2OG dioxygenase domain-containing protein n=1 Tax=Stylosanthes scabra TaxID=79078 RepID=A0ABU6X6S7_9FABA|nr:hypothetical protein [Stylosanthes scabra]
MEARSILVPCVQELAKQPLTTVPQRYIRPDQDPTLLSATISEALPQLPVIDMTKLLSQDLKQSELQKLDHACKEWGFFQLVNHGVSTSLVENVKTGSKQFFDLPMEEKNKFWQTEGDIQGFGQSFVVSEEQKLDWADRFYMITFPSHLRKPHLFPYIPLPFRDDLDTYSAELEKLCIKILELMANALAIDPREIKETFKEGTQIIRINYYPPCPQPELVIGQNTHSDAGGITILVQVDDVEGLQIRKDGMWIPVKPLPNAFIINIGDTIEMITNGVYGSVEHATVNSKKERMSIATFYSPKREAMIAPVASLVSEERAAQFKSMSVAEHFRWFLSRPLSGKSHLDELRIQNENHKE